MKKAIRILFFNILLYIAIQTISIFVAFYLLGIGISAPSEQYIGWVKYPGVVLQIFIILYFRYRQRYLSKNLEFVLSFVALILLSIFWELQ